MKPISGNGSLVVFDKIVRNYLKDGYFVAVFFKDASLIFLKLTHANGNHITAKYNIAEGTYNVY